MQPDSPRQHTEMIEAMRRAKVATGYFMHVESILVKQPPSRWPELLRSIRLHAPAEWFK
jgi:hypothetical protein